MCDNLKDNNCLTLRQGVTLTLINGTFISTVVAIVLYLF